MTTTHQPGQPFKMEPVPPGEMDDWGNVNDPKARLRTLERMPKRDLAYMHVRNGGQMGLSTYLKWTKDELVRIVAEDEGIDPWSA